MNPNSNPNHASSANLYPHPNSQCNSNPSVDPTSNLNATFDSNHNNINFPSNCYINNDRNFGSTPFSNPNPPLVLDRQSPQPISNFSTKNDRTEERRDGSPSTFQNPSYSRIERSNSYPNPLEETKEGKKKIEEKEISDHKDGNRDVNSDDDDDDDDDFSDDGDGREEKRTLKKMRWKGTYAQILSENRVQLTEEALKSTDKIHCPVCERGKRGWIAVLQHSHSKDLKKKDFRAF